MGDCALFYLLKKRIDGKYRQLEKMGASTPQMISQLSGGNYKPNPKVENFDLEKLIKDIDPEKAWDMPGQATGGTVADSKGPCELRGSHVLAAAEVVPLHQEVPRAAQAAQRL